MPLPVSLTASMTYSPGLTETCFRSSLIVKSDVCRFNRHFAAARHRIACIDDEVHDYLFDLSMDRL